MRNEDVGRGMKSPAKTKTVPPRLQLSGEDKALKAARKAGWSEEQISTFMNEAKSGDYDHLLQTCMKHFDVH